MFSWLKKNKSNTCVNEDWCTCPNLTGRECSKCGWYKPINSGFGICIALPQTEVVEWCRLPCSLYLVAYKVIE